VSDERQRDARSGTLGSIRQLEEALEARSHANVAAETRLEAARTEASRILASAREEAAAAVAQRRRQALDAAADDVAAIGRAAEETAARVRRDARQHRSATVDAAVTLVLPAAGERGA
jgi:vacuolar-type H+-ATPase subunit H